MAASLVSHVKKKFAALPVLLHTDITTASVGRGPPPLIFYKKLASKHVSTQIEYSGLYRDMGN